MEYRKRKPDYEDDYIRAWKAEKNSLEKKEVEELESIKIKHRGQEFGLCGFAKVKDKETDDVLFYYKIKEDGDSWMMLYYIVDDSKKIKIMEILNGYEKSARQMQKVLLGAVNFEVKDVRVYLNSALESNIIEEEEKDEG